MFFTSPRLAALSTQAEILAVQLQATQAALPKAVQQTQQAAQQQQQQQGGSCGAGCGCAQGSGGSGMGAGLAASAACRQRMLEEYQCPICLETLHNPVVLTCAHRCGWCVCMCVWVQARGGKAAGRREGLGAKGMLEESQCLICLVALHNPVVLTCTHRCGAEVQGGYGQQRGVRG